MFNKLLIANRGEIAVRVMRTASRMGIATVAVYSDADAGAMHVAEADEAVRVGPAAAAESYLNVDAIIAAAKQTGAQAIHPGYGFLSENPAFVEAVEAAGLTFVGPPASAILAMGLKDAAKALMEKAGVPVVPGYHGEEQGADFLASVAGDIGYPVLIKARAGGGGKGMRKVERAADFTDALAGAQREAKASFGDIHVLIEKYVTAPRHIEIQVFGDNHGQAVHLFERDCSLQRRHQKVIEEAPAPGMPDEVRAAMGEAAVKAAKAIGYSGAGTVEFIVDGSEGLKADRFWFMEMNTRLQVEHPVTEAITGLDLVELQLRMAAGEPLPFTQGQLAINGHAFEARLYAEDVPKGFLPATGTLEYLRFSETARNDTGVREGDEITPFYDPMIAKVIVHGADRDQALARMRAALADTLIAGTVTNKAFLSALCAHEGFASGQVDTGLIERDLAALTAQVPPPPLAMAVAALAVLGVAGERHGTDPWASLSGFRLWGAAQNFLTLVRGGEAVDVRVTMRKPGDFKVSLGDGVVNLQLVPGAPERMIVDGHAQPMRYAVSRAGGRVSGVTVFLGGETFEFSVPDSAGELTDGASGDDVRAPMPGLVTQVRVTAGAMVSKGDAVAVLEAMKMEHTLTAPRDGVVAAVNVGDGDQVKDGDLLVSLQPENG
ncbi:MAG: acetyl/propionyl/methylcrotonyl-CoA carboxylase subunit alpha [Anderseniella sp.]|jgi:3-methylcrotonyl-CoA carboxylase alpha subunit|nr:acetyl/propionyl/methylcrotonyl-CoA carboxylase subunit alpha [Anderseniella sp.]